MVASPSKFLFLAALGAGIASHVYGQPVSDAELTRRQALQNERAQSRVSNTPDVFTPPQSDAPDSLELADESPCFPILFVEWRGNEPFPWLAAEEKTVITKCVGARGLRAFQDHLTRQLIARGFITSRVFIPEQNLASGRLVIQVVPGRLGKIRDHGSAAGNNFFAIAASEGDLFNQRDLDQALENIRRLASQSEVEMELVPGAKPGETDIVVKHPEGRRWRSLVTLDDAGTTSTGKYQLGGVITFDSPLHLYDMLTVALNQDANFSSSFGTNSASINWSLPFGYWQFFAGATQSSYKQTVAGFSGNIAYSGHSYGVEGGIGYVPYRTQSARGTLQAKLNRKVSRSWIDDAEIDVQYRSVVGFEANFGHRQYLGNGSLDLNIGVRGSMPSQSNAPGLVIGAPDWDGRYRIGTAAANLMLPFQAGGAQFRYQGNVRVQRTTALVPAFEYFSIGNRYTVRGFDGVSTLAAEEGWVLRNDFTWIVARSGVELFAAIDAGRVAGPHAATLAGTSLTGAALGVRGRYGPANYEFTLGRPVKKPDSFDTQSLSLTVSLGAEF
jgi:hemolysin activation/secretion protein